MIYSKWNTYFLRIEWHESRLEHLKLSLLLLSLVHYWISIPDIDSIVHCVLLVGVPANGNRFLLHHVHRFVLDDVAYLGTVAARITVAAAWWIIICCGCCCVVCCHTMHHHCWTTIKWGRVEMCEKMPMTTVCHGLCWLVLLVVRPSVSFVFLATLILKLKMMLLFLLFLSSHKEKRKKCAKFI